MSAQYSIKHANSNKTNKHNNNNRIMNTHDIKANSEDPIKNPSSTDLYSGLNGDGERRLHSKKKHHNKAIGNSDASKVSKSRSINAPHHSLIGSKYNLAAKPKINRPRKPSPQIRPVTSYSTSPKSSKLLDLLRSKRSSKSSSSSSKSSPSSNKSSSKSKKSTSNSKKTTDSADSTPRKNSTKVTPFLQGVHELLTESSSSSNNSIGKNTELPSKLHITTSNNTSIATTQNKEHSNTSSKSSTPTSSNTYTSTEIVTKISPQTETTDSSQNVERPTQKVKKSTENEANSSTQNKKASTQNKASTSLQQVKNSSGQNEINEASQKVEKSTQDTVKSSSQNGIKHSLPNGEDDSSQTMPKPSTKNIVITSSAMDGDDSVQKMEKSMANSSTPYETKHSTQTEKNATTPIVEKSSAQNEATASTPIEPNNSTEDIPKSSTQKEANASTSNVPNSSPQKVRKPSVQSVAKPSFQNAINDIPNITKSSTQNETNNSTQDVVKLSTQNRTTISKQKVTHDSDQKIKKSTQNKKTSLRPGKTITSDQNVATSFNPVKNIDSARNVEKSLTQNRTNDPSQKVERALTQNTTSGSLHNLPKFSNQNETITFNQRVEKPTAQLKTVDSAQNLEKAITQNMVKSPTHNVVNASIQNVTNISSQTIRQQPIQNKAKPPNPDVSNASAQKVVNAFKHKAEKISAQKVSNASTQHITNNTAQNVVNTSTQSEANTSIQYMTDASTDSINVITQNVINAIARNMAEAITQNDANIIIQSIVKAFAQNNTKTITQQIANTIIQNMLKAFAQHNINVRNQNNLNIITPYTANIITQSMVKAITQHNTNIIAQHNAILLAKNNEKHHALHNSKLHAVNLLAQHNAKTIAQHDENIIPQPVPNSTTPNNFSANNARRIINYNGLSKDTNKLSYVPRTSSRNSPPINSTLGEPIHRVPVQQNNSAKEAIYGSTPNANINIYNSKNNNTMATRQDKHPRNNYSSHLVSSNAIYENENPTTFVFDPSASIQGAISNGKTNIQLIPIKSHSNPNLNKLNYDKNALTRNGPNISNHMGNSHKKIPDTDNTISSSNNSGYNNNDLLVSNPSNKAINTSTVKTSSPLLNISSKSYLFRKSDISEFNPLTGTPYSGQQNQQLPQMPSRSAMTNHNNTYSGPAPIVYSRLRQEQLAQLPNYQVPNSLRHPASNSISDASKDFIQNIQSSQYSNSSAGMPLNQNILNNNDKQTIVTSSTPNTNKVYTKTSTINIEGNRRILLSQIHGPEQSLSNYKITLSNGLKFDSLQKDAKIAEKLGRYFDCIASSTKLTVSESNQNIVDLLRKMNMPIETLPIESSNFPKVFSAAQNTSPMDQTSVKDLEIFKTGKLLNTHTFKPSSISITSILNEATKTSDQVTLMNNKGNPIITHPSINNDNSQNQSSIYLNGNGKRNRGSATSELEHREAEIQPTNPNIKLHDSIGKELNNTKKDSEKQLNNDPLTLNLESKINEKVLYSKARLPQEITIPKSNNDTQLISSDLDNKFQDTLKSGMMETIIISDSDFSDLDLDQEESVKRSSEHEEVVPAQSSTQQAVSKPKDVKRPMLFEKNKRLDDYDKCRKKFTRDFNIYANSKLKGKNTFLASTLIDLLDTGLIPYSSLEESYYVSGTNDVCSIQNFVTSNAFIFQQPHKGNSIKYLEIEDRLIHKNVSSDRNKGIENKRLPRLPQPTDTSMKIESSNSVTQEVNAVARITSRYKNINKERPLSSHSSNLTNNDVMAVQSAIENRNSISSDTQQKGSDIHANDSTEIDNTTLPSIKEAKKDNTRPKHSKVRLDWISRWKYYLKFSILFFDEQSFIENPPPNNMSADELLSIVAKIRTIFLEKFNSDYTTDINNRFHIFIYNDTSTQEQVSVLTKNYLTAKHINDTSHKIRFWNINKALKFIKDLGVDLNGDDTSYSKMYEKGAIDETPSSLPKSNAVSNTWPSTQTANNPEPISDTGIKVAGQTPAYNATVSKSEEHRNKNHTSQKTNDPNPLFSQVKKDNIKKPEIQENKIETHNNIKNSYTSNQSCSVKSQHRENVTNIEVSVSSSKANDILHDLAENKSKNISSSSSLNKPKPPIENLKNSSIDKARSCENNISKEEHVLTVNNTTETENNDIESEEIKYMTSLLEDANATLDRKDYELLKAQKIIEALSTEVLDSQIQIATLTSTLNLYKRKYENISQNKNNISGRSTQEPKWKKAKINHAD
ncbi:hypothetical protein TBLA_0H00560 [Henningerozyma blattae CBS 6284]|uniref:Sir4 SID domain-containing protein n=1 Tax=Henningerozyma blattae (strain ATCC 34711 / CBS 6284 / DSM 70876 / NBRC 10599 / NRRL Y-10934 / UCD 77-7) TaxID=1071380 RepID=I2H7J6_HENB6|nr:hypothetical protein TBLA_0H00560 [Tetrapisispora blattae CBS 6284]CCH62348.1 hypothetical protein TBLA_0H00560 [Tetrapisispora blattae CBS 6284]